MIESNVTVRPGTLIIAKNQFNLDEYECRIVGLGMLGSGLCGRGYTPHGALTNFNLLCAKKKRRLKDNPDALLPDLRSWKQQPQFTT